MSQKCIIKKTKTRKANTKTEYGTFYILIYHKENRNTNREHQNRKYTIRKTETQKGNTKTENVP